MRVVKLKPKSKHGRDRINQHGSNWENLGPHKWQGLSALLLQSLRGEMAYCMWESGWHASRRETPALVAEKIN